MKQLVMQHWRRATTMLATAAVLGTTLGSLPNPAAAQGQARAAGQTVYALTENNSLLQFDSTTPGSIQSRRPVQGLQGSERLLGIDVRPATGQLYGLGSSSRLYTIDPASGQATAVGSAPFTTTLQGSRFGVDFNPVVDRLRIVSDSGQNLRLNPINGAIGGIDGTLAYTPTDSGAGSTPFVVGAAYTNNVSGTTSTELFVIDSRRDVLALQSPPNAGALTTRGPLGMNVEALLGFDIAPSGTAYVAALAADGIPGTVLATLDLATGKLTTIGRIGQSERIVGLALPLAAPGRGVYALTEQSELLQIDSASPGQVLNRRPVQGLQGSERLLGIDVRPATGQLYGLGSSSRLYTIDPASGQATAVGSAPFTTTLQGSRFGVDFNPVVDRLRIVSDSGQNLRLNPINGAIGGIDGTLAYTPTDAGAGSTPFVVGAAYTNNVSGTTSTELFVIDSRRDVLALQSPPNAGALTTRGPLGLNVEALLGFDITTGGTAYVAALANDGIAGAALSTLDLATGKLTTIGRIGQGERIVGLAIPTQP